MPQNCPGLLFPTKARDTSLVSAKMLEMASVRDDKKVLESQSKAWRAGWPTGEVFNSIQREIFGIILQGEHEDAIKQALKTRFGSLEEPAKVASRWEVELRLAGVSGDQKFLNVVRERLLNGTFDAPLESPWASFEQKWAEGLQQSFCELQDDEQWEKLAAHDPEAYAKRLDEVLGDIKRMMNARVGIGAHAPRRNEVRDEIILLLKFNHPDWSFGRVAQEYRKLTGSPINPENENSDPKLAERTYKKRCEQKVDDLIAFLRCDLKPFYKLKTLA